MNPILYQDLENRQSPDPLRSVSIAVVRLFGEKKLDPTTTLSFDGRIKGQIFMTTGITGND